MKTKLTISLMILLFAGLGMADFLVAEKKSIAEVLSKTISEKGLDAALSQYQQLKKNNYDQYDFSEAQLNNLGYQLLYAGKFTEAIAILKLNTRNFPKSPNTYDSLAEAFLKSGDTTLAIENYEIVLKRLPAAALDEQTATFLKNNAESKLDYLRHPERHSDRRILNNFLNEGEFPFGKLHPKAPPETEQFGQLAGIWECTNSAFFQGRWVSGWKATWAWKYILDGFAVQDLWIQKEIDLPPPAAGLKRDLAGTNMRLYNPQTKRWEIMWFTNANNSSTIIYAEQQGDAIVMKPEAATNSPQRRITFYGITRESFEWKSEVLQEDGETWQATTKISAKRVK